MSMPEGNPRIPEGINTRNENPLGEFLTLAAGVGAAMVALVFTISLAVAYLAPHIPFEWELPASPPVESFSQSGEAAEDSPASPALRKLAAALLQSSLAVPVDGENAAAQVPPGYFDFFLIPMDTPNAFATLGAKIAVSDALLRHVRSENGLAMVLAHEIAHVQLRHPIEAAGRGIVVQIALTAMLGDSAGSVLGGTLGTGGMLTMLSFNRDMELEADRRALDILQAHYGHIGGADEFFRDLAANQDSADWLEFAQTHPSSDRRLALIREAMASSGAAGPISPLPAALKLEQH